MRKILLVSLLTIVALVVLLAATLPWLVSTTPIQGLETARSSARPESRFVTIPFDGTDGLDIHFLTGSRVGGPLVPSYLLLHGFTFNAFTWTELLDFFDARGRVVAYDQPPYGLSAKPIAGEWQGPSPYTREAAVQQLFGVMDALGMDRAVLVGNSAGGALALEASLARPDRVTALILLDPWIYVRRPTLPEAIAELPQVARLSLFLARRLGQSEGLLRRSYAEPNRITPERLALTGIHAGVKNWDLAWGELLHRSLTSVVAVSDRLEEVTQPTLVISGRDDRLVPLADSERAVEALPNADLVTLPDCGHVPQEECPDQVREAIADWLDEPRPSAEAPLVSQPAG